MPLGNFYGSELYTLSLAGGSGDQMGVSVALPYVNRVDYLRNSTAVPQWSLSGRNVFIHHAGVRAEKIVVFGRSGGVEFKQGYEKTGVKRYDQGYKLFQELEDFLYGYEQVRGGQKLASSIYAKPLKRPIRLVFRALHENKNVYAEPINFSWTRDARGSRFGYIYRLELLAYKEATFEADDTWLDTLNKARDSFNAYINQATMYVAAFRDDINEITSTLNGISGMIRSLRRLVREGSKTAQTFQGSVNGIAVMLSSEAHGLCSDVLQVLDDTADAVTLGYHSASGGTKLFHELRRSLADHNRRVSVAIASNGWSGLPPSNLEDGEELNSTTVQLTSALTSGQSGGSSANPGLDTENGVIEVEIHQGESIRDFAFRLTGNPEAWIAVAMLNKLKNAKTLADGSPIVAGTKLLVPLPSGAGGAILSPGSPPYGVDLKISSQGDLVLTGKSGGLAQVYGVECLRQGIMNRLMTHAGEVPGAPTMGMPMLIGEKQLASSIGTLVLAMESQLLSDFRVDAVADLSVDEGAGVIEIKATVSPFAGTPFDVIHEEKVVS